jgi:phosphate transport system substrate-binding protein
VVSKRLASLTCAALFAGAVFGLAGTAAASAAPLSGAGSTLVAPIEAEWAAAWAQSTGNPQPTYAAVGSGTGLSDIGKGLVDFGASDAPLSASTTPCSGCYQIPWAVSATGIGYHLSGVSGLRLTGSVLAGIYLGQIRYWNSKAITSINPGKRLPHLQITPVYRSDGSGDTYAFTNYLSDVNRTWASRIGYSTSVGSWPAGVGAHGNSGIVSELESTNGSIGYVAVSYLFTHRLPAAAIKNAAGRFEYPNLSNINNAASTVHHVPSGNTLHIVDPGKSAKIAYPISTFTYAIVPSNAPQGALLKQFIEFALNQGRQFAAALDFGRLPLAVIDAAKATLNKIH